MTGLPPGPDRPSATLEISATTARRYVMGRQGLWPGRRWRGLEGAGLAMRAMEDLQLDPLVVVARAHDLALHSRVADYAIDDWATLTYERREFFEWGGWLAVRPMEELPIYRVLMRRERQHGHWLEVEREHGPAIEEMRAILRSGREVSNRDFEMRHRTRIDDYRGRKDSALALHYLWRVGEAMVTRRDRFERIYALTEAVAPAWALRDIDPAEADDRLMLKTIAADGLGQGLIGINSMLRRPLTAAESAAWRARLLADGSLMEVRVEGWKRPQLAIGSDAALLAELERGTVPAAWAPIDTTTTEEAAFLSPLDPVSARGRAKPLFGFDYVWEVYKPLEQRRFGYYTMPILWGDRLVGRFDPKLDRTTGTLVINGLWLEDPALARDAAFADALALGMARFGRFLGASRIDVAAVPWSKSPGEAARYSGSPAPRRPAGERGGPAMIVFERSRQMKASPEAVWSVVSDVTRWPEWFTEAERCEVLSGAGIGQRQRMYGHARGKATEIDSVITFWNPPTLLRWHHEAERVDGQPGSVVFAKDATAQITVESAGVGDSLVTYRLEAEPGSLRNTFMLRVLAPRPIGKSFESSLAALAALVE